MIAQEQAKLPLAVQQRIRTGTLSTQPWDSYLKTYLWHVQFSQPLKLYDYSARYFSAKNNSYPLTVDPFLPRATNFLVAQARSVPSNRYL